MNNLIINISNHFEDATKNEFIKKYNTKNRTEKIKILIHFFIRNIAKEYFNCEIYKPISYVGNGNTKMFNFSFRLEYIDAYVSEKINVSDKKILEFPYFICENGDIKTVLPETINNLLL